MKEQTKFYVFRQNNAGGQFLEVDGKVGKFTVVEATSFPQANDLFFDGVLDTPEVRKVSRYLDKPNYCDCCGARWQAQESEEEGDYTGAYPPCDTLEEVVRKHSGCVVNFLEVA